MSDKKISQLTAAAALTGTELVPIVQSGITVSTTAQDIADLGGGGTLPVETVYPTTDALKAGTRFWYKGNEWHYMTQDEIDSIGWTGLVSIGFPAPVSKTPNLYILSDVLLKWGYIWLDFPGLAGNVDVLGVGNPTRLSSFNTYAFLSIKNVGLLSNLQDLGTTIAWNLNNKGLSAILINNVFTQLPITTNVATLDVRNNPGAATCDPTIATAKGYTVITS